MRCSDVVWIFSLKKEGALMSCPIDVKTGEKRCVVYCGGDEHYIVDEGDLEFVETFEEALRNYLSEHKDA